MSGADNQQESSVKVQWIVGFTDGEGSFSVSIYRNEKAGLKLGWQIFPEFVITQGESSLNVLEEIQDYFQCGHIYASKQDSKTHKEVLYRYCVRALQDLKETIVPFFEENKLRSAKKKEFNKFSKIVEMIAQDKHKSREGLREIAKIVETMNQKKKSAFLNSSETIRQT